jgi:hypothetical protein
MEDYVRQLVGLFVAVLMIAGCEQKYQTVTPEIQSKMMDDLKSGNLVLDCGVNCNGSWIFGQRALNHLDLSENWNALAVGVMKIGYQQDLGYYYLGQAAQGLGYHEAAIKYYQYAGALASGPPGPQQCASMPIQSPDAGCYGVDLLSVLPTLIQASEDALATQRGTTTVDLSTTPASANQGGTTKAHKRSKKWVMPPPPTK